jgi:hypothetical protein
MAQEILVFLRAGTLYTDERVDAELYPMASPLAPHRFFLLLELSDTIM